MELSLFSPWKLARTLAFTSVVALALLIPGWLLQPLNTLQTHTTSTCQSPPAGFNPATASASNLALYGFPQRPTESSSLAQWLKMVSGAKTHICLTASNTKRESVSTLASTFATKATARTAYANAALTTGQSTTLPLSYMVKTASANAAATTGQSDPTHSGYAITTSGTGGSHQPITNISGTFTIPCVGLDPSSTPQVESTIGWDTVAVGVSSDYKTGGHRLVYWDGTNSGMQVLTSYNLSCTTQVNMYVSYNSSNGYYTLYATANNSANPYIQLTVTGSGAPTTGAVGETRPDSTTPLYNFSHVAWQNCMVQIGTQGAHALGTAATGSSLIQMDMVNSSSGHTLAIPSTLSSDRESFTDTFLQAS